MIPPSWVVTGANSIATGAISVGRTGIAVSTSLAQLASFAIASAGEASKTRMQLARRIIIGNPPLRSDAV